MVSLGPSILLKDTSAEQMSADTQHRSSVLRLQWGLPTHYTTLLPFIDFLLFKAKKPTWKPTGKKKHVSQWKNRKLKAKIWQIWKPWPFSELLFSADRNLNFFVIALLWLMTPCPGCCRVFSPCKSWSYIQYYSHLRATDGNVISWLNLAK